MMFASTCGLELGAVHRRAGGLRDRRDRADVVEVGVGEQDRLDRRDRRARRAPRAAARPRRRGRRSPRAREPLAADDEAVLLHRPDREHPDVDHLLPSPGGSSPLAAPPQEHLDVVARRARRSPARARRTAARSRPVAALRGVSSRKTNSSAAAKPARMSELFQVGGVLRRFSRACARACFLRSSGARRAAGAAPRLDRPGGGAAVLGPALALRLCHLVVELSAQPRSSASSIVRRFAERDRRPGSRSKRRAPAPARRARRSRTAAWRRIALDHARQRRRTMVLDVGRHLRDAAVLEPQADRADRRQPLRPAFADQRGDLARVLERRGRRELDVEGDQRRARRDEHGAGGRVQTCGGPKSGASSPLAIRAASAAGPPRRISARVRPPASIAVEEHRQRRARSPSRSASTSASAQAAPRSRRRGRRSARRRSRRPAGARPRGRRRSIRVERLARAVASMACGERAGTRPPA